MPSPQLEIMMMAEKNSKLDIGKGMDMGQRLGGNYSDVRAA